MAYMNVYYFPKRTQFPKPAIESGTRSEFELALSQLQKILEPYEVYNLLTSHARRIKNNLQDSATLDGVRKSK